MDQKELQENIALYYSKLPPKAQAAFSAMEWLNTLEKISVKYGLNDTQKETLGTETTLLLLGIIHIVEYEENLTSELALARDTADKMLVEINNSILKDITPELSLAFNENSKADPAETVEIEPVMDKGFEKLPQETQEVIRNSNYQGILFGIGQKYALSVAQIGTLERATTELIAGAIKPDTFQDSLRNKMGLPEEKLTPLVNEVNEKIFRQIRQGVMTADTPIEPTEQKEIFKQAGIEIVEKIAPNPPSTAAAGGKNTLPVLDTLEIEAPKSIQKSMPSILANKLTTDVQSTMKQTDYSAVPVPSAAPQKEIPQGYTTDPYREIPE